MIFSELIIKQAYIGKNGKKSVHSETTVVCRDFKFFAVEVEVSQSAQSLS